jgi:hypothetical protein
MIQAKEKFHNNLKTIRQLIIDKPILAINDKEIYFKTYDFYELGPWIVLDVLNTFEGGFHTELVSSIVKQVEEGKAIEHDKILEIIKIALRIKLHEFINFHSK